MRLGPVRTTVGAGAFLGMVTVRTSALGSVERE